VINSKVKWTKPIHVDDFDFLRARTGAVPKLTIPGPCAVHFRGGDAAVTAHAYRDVAEFWDDIVAAFRAELEALAQAGCTYVQIDETAFAKFGDADVQAALAARGDDWSRLIDTYIAVTNRVLRDLPASLRIGMHLCRGNRGGTWHAEGSYDAVAERLFNALAIPIFLLEYDSPRAGDFTPLRHVPDGKHIVLGLVSTKTSALEDKDALKRRLDAASRHVDLARLSVSPQCGFASVAEGNPITPQAQEAKLRLIVELAEEVWGTS
jgi:5-methyltetrahydropteroyltriglutamate--homocysteine methyltransferase